MLDSLIHLKVVTEEREEGIHDVVTTIPHSRMKFRGGKSSFMIMTINKQYKHDAEHEILYFTVGQYSPSVADEIIDYVYVKRSIDTDEVTQVIIEDLKV